KAYSLGEVSSHDSLKSLWIIYKGDIYDVTEFAKDHPGGDDLLLKYAGQDIT
ncbi:cytochrome b5-like heme/steroid binding domain-containing protein, partial [Sporodiniella umbellata]